ncbi:hypothetical protein ACWDO0_15345 [Nocardia rhamnosiphila]
MLIPTKTAFIAGISALLISATTGCISSGGTETLPAVPTSTSTPHPDCSPRALAAHPDPEVEKFALSLSLGRDISVEAAQVLPATTHPGKLVLSITVCVPHSSDSDSLRPVASDIAHELIKTELGRKTYSFSVRDQSVQGGIETILRVKDFSDRPWDGSPSLEAELNSWEEFPS